MWPERIFSTWFRRHFDQLSSLNSSEGVKDPIGYVEWIHVHLDLVPCICTLDKAARYRFVLSVQFIGCCPVQLANTVFLMFLLQSVFTWRSCRTVSLRPLWLSMAIRLLGSLAFSPRTFSGQPNHSTANSEPASPAFPLQTTSISGMIMCRFLKRTSECMGRRRFVTNEEILNWCKYIDIRVVRFSTFFVAKLLSRLL